MKQTDIQNLQKNREHITNEPCEIQSAAIDTSFTAWTMMFVVVVISVVVVIVVVVSITVVPVVVAVVVAVVVVEVVMVVAGIAMAMKMVLVVTASRLFYNRVKINPNNHKK